MAGGTLQVHDEDFSRNNAGVGSISAVILLEENMEFGFAVERPSVSSFGRPLDEQLASFCEFGKATRIVDSRVAMSNGAPLCVPTFVNEFWTARQRAASSLHEISYRACFKPQLPRFFIQRLTKPGEVVYDPFMGRGTTVIETALLGRVPYGCDINPLSIFLTRPRLEPPSVEEVAARLHEPSPLTGARESFMNVVREERGSGRDC